MITFIDSVSGMSSTFYVQGDIPGARDVLLNVTVCAFKKFTVGD